MSRWSLLAVLLASACGGASLRPSPAPAEPAAAPFAPAALPAEIAAPLKTLTDEQYPDNPNLGNRSDRTGSFAHDAIRLHHDDGTTYDVEITPSGEGASTIRVHGVDLAVYTPRPPTWLADPYLRRIALQNQEWNRIQMRFDVGDRVEVTGGPEGTVTSRVDIANNCLNAGLWEVILFTKESGEDLPYYQAWFDFPLDAYAALYEQVAGAPWAAEVAMLKDWTPLPSDRVALDALRAAGPDEALAFTDHADALPPLTGERKKKLRNVIFPTDADAISDYLTDATRFATFAPPGVYRRDDPRVTHLGRLATVESAVRRVVQPRGGSLASATEIEIGFRSATGEATRLVIGGFDAAALPKLPLGQHQRGFQMPMGIGNQSFYQKYAEARPADDAWYALLLDGEGRWLDSHDIGIDGPLMYRDDADPDRVHVMLLSFERHAIVGHVELPMPLSPPS